MRKLRYVYHVVYYYLDYDKNTGVGSMTLYRDCPIKTEKDIDSVTEFIIKKESFTNVVLLNFLLLNKRGR